MPSQFFIPPQIEKPFWIAMDAFLESVSRLQTQLSQLAFMVSQANPDATALQQYFLTLQQHFQAGILGITLPPTASVQPILIEMNRTFRLLGTDIAFLQAARHPSTIQQRQKQMRDRIDQLQIFCQGLVNLGNLPTD